MLKAFSFKGNSINHISSSLPSPEFNTSGVMSDTLVL